MKRMKIPKLDRDMLERVAIYYYNKAIVAEVNRISNFKIDASKLLFVLKKLDLMESDLSD